MKTKFTALVIMLLSLVISSSVFAEGYLVTSDLWIRAVINTVEKGPIEAVWQEGGEDTTSRGDTVIWGHFYASPSDVTWGSQNNPDLFVKIWFDVSGRVDVNYFHVSVPDIVVYSDYPYDGTADEQGTTTMSRRYIRQYYENGQSHSEENCEDGNPPSGCTAMGNPSGYSTINDLRIGSIINTVEKGPIDAVWRFGGQDTTSRGDEVVWGHFYASPSDVTWGSQDNPDLYVKIWFDVSGRVDVNFFHVSVPDIEVYSDLPNDGTYDQKGTTIMDNRYIRHEYWGSTPEPEAQATIGPEGGVVEVTDPDSPIAGTKLSFPAGALDQNTMFSLRYDALHDSKNLMARPIIIDHPDIQLHENINVTLPLREVPTEDTTLMIMFFDDELNTYVPTGLLVDVVASDTLVHFQLAHLSGFSLDEAKDALKEMSNATLVFLITKLGYLSNAIDESIEANDTGVLLTFFESWDGLSEACEDEDACRMINELVLSGIIDIVGCGTGERVTDCVHTLRYNKDDLLRALSKETPIISICDKVNGFHWAYYPDWFSYPEEDSEYLKFRLVYVADQGGCMGRCGNGCPGDGLPRCGNVFRYTQACLNHDACAEDFGLLSRPCMSILDYCGDDCLYAPICENAGDCYKLDPNCDGCIDSEELAIAEEM